MPWVTETELANSIEDLKTSPSVTGRVYPHFETLCARISTALKKIVQGSNLWKKMFLEERKAQNEDRFIRGHEPRVLLRDRSSRVHQ